MFFVNVSVNETERVRTVTWLICMHVKIYLTHLNHAACACICVWMCMDESWKEGSEPFPPSLHFLDLDWVAFPWLRRVEVGVVLCCL